MSFESARDRYKIRKSEHNQITAAVSRSLGNDRPHAEVQIGDLQLVGRLDSAASVSILAKVCRELVEKLRAKIERYYSSVTMASEKTQTALGKVKLKIKDKEKVREIRRYQFRKRYQLTHW